MRIFTIVLFIILISFKLKAQDSVRGVIKEAATGIPLPGINISVPGYSAAITNEKGFFRIKVPGYDAILTVSGQGYQVKEIVLKGRHTVTASLREESFNSVYDDATLPFGKRPQNHISYSIASVNTDDKWQRISESPESYLQGRAAGLNVVRRSGTPGIGADLFLRGYTSLYATNKPLIVVDGMIYDINEYGGSLITGHVNNPLADIDIKDIDNFTVIKDGTSTYGTRGANGVILITTSRTKELATKIDFAASGGFNAAVSKLPVMGAGDYRIYLSDLLKSSGLTDAQISEKPYMNDNLNPDYNRYHYNTDWQKKIMSNSYNQQYYLKVSGGDDIAVYGLSLGYLKQAGIIDNTDLSRYQTRFNADLNLSAKLKTSVNLAFTSNQQRGKNQGIANKTNPLYLGLVKAPFLPTQVVSDEGIESPSLADYDIFNVSNPAAIIENMQAVNKNYRFSGSINFRYQLNKSVNLQTLLGVTYDKVRENFFIPERGVAPDTLSNGVAYNRSASNVERFYALYNDTRFSYSHTFNQVHHFSANAGIRFNNNNSESDYGFGYNSATDEFVSVGMGQSQLRQIGGGVGKWNWLNTYVNADYALLNKYFLSFNMAIDGSSRFGKQAPGALTIGMNKYAVMPSVAAGWLISSESFLSGANFIEVLKLRASYGKVGNDDIGNYTARQYYISQNLLGMQGLVRGNIGNPNLKWETVEKMNAGLDASFLNERLNISVDVFNNNTTDMLTVEPVKTVTGFKSVITNSSAMKTRGFELTVSGRIVDRNFKWDMGLNVARYENEITKIPGNRILTSYANATILTEKGHPANQFYGYKTNGVFISDEEALSSGLTHIRADGTTAPFAGGDIRFIDKNGDHLINDDDRQVIGNPNPSLTGMFSNMISWKRWSLDAVFTFSKGNDIYNYTRANIESMSDAGNQSLAMVNRWRADGQVTAIPRTAWGDPSGNARFSDRWIEDGSYLRLRTMSITYNLPLKRGALKYVKISATGNNIFTFTNYLGYDPEFSASSSLFTQGIDVGLEPQFRTIQLGVRIGL
ncbi:TonB-linked outer membrane protein, SusC/RagA family [Chitinophaga sp. CF118]|uniref:SusC/RagA family TonB-linked outer membrane protein n=1 Tax=Chitinophaga sp. CF118 TaxID=1884367 RepID=UPI0008E3904B|nr:SusC/RagA family TonB-linked outer membrane protein [Chitinophaga sp. CF118]SFE96656.1 TonB-linked outer membrane protein, SusC/RagA family [Chitinophaga sp. CF118]